MSGESKPNDWPSSKFRPKKSRLKWAAFFWRCIGDNFLSSRETAPETKYVIFQGANIAPRFKYNPELWKTLESLGVGKLAVQGARERELANVYRGNDAARQLDDEDFAEVLSFTRRAFEMAVGFRGAADQRRPR